MKRTASPRRRLRALAAALALAVGTAGFAFSMPATTGGGSPATAAATSGPGTGGTVRDAAAASIVSEAPLPGGGGFWYAYSDGVVIAEGAAAIYGDLSGVHLNAPIVSIASTPDGHGYWMVAADGGIFNFGDATFYGSTGNIRLNKPVVGMAASPDGRGYWLVASDGGIFNFGDAPFRGSAVGSLGGAAAVGILAAGPGYWVLTTSGSVLGFDAPPLPAVGAPLPVLANPTGSIAPPAQFDLDCEGGGGSAAACDADALAAINQARAGEGLGPLQLPPDYEQLPLVAQLVAVANAERTSRGLPALPENATLDELAAQGAQGGQDPTGPAGYAWGSNIAWGYSTALAADFAWMYDDGPGGTNLDCTAANTSGCWGHRDNILSAFAGQAGAGAYDNGGREQLTELFVANYP